VLGHFLDGIPILSLHGKIPAKYRPKTLADFRKMASGVLVCTDVAARGIDIPDIDWVIQYDPPQDPAAFVHRCGRTARIGREGRAVVLLLPSEETYVSFLKLRNIPIKDFAEAIPPTATLEEIRGAAAADRDMYEKGLLAFVSFVRGYKEHQLSYIFQLKDMDLGQAAMGFGLLHLPSMPEFRTNKNAAKNFTPR